jgi:hypothetical protein
LYQFCRVEAEELEEALPADQPGARRLEHLPPDLIGKEFTSRQILY